MLVGGEGGWAPRHRQFCRCDCSVLMVAGVSLVLSVQSFRKLIMQVGGGGPLSFYEMMLWSCARKVVGCERFGEGLPMFFVVLCDDVVRELFARVVEMK